MSQNVTLRNVSYLFLPFVFGGSLDPAQLNQTFRNSSDWNTQENSCRYMLRYISDKLNSQRDDCLCFHHVLSAEGLNRLALPETVWETAAQFYGKQTAFAFRINNLHLFCFHTRVCIAALEIVSEASDPISISSLQFCLKNAGRAKLSRRDDPSGSAVTPLSLLRDALRDVVPSEQADFCFFSEESALRSNVLSYTELKKNEDSLNALFYLRRCYNETYEYQENEERDRMETYSSVKNIVWGVTPEAAACAVTVTSENSQFIEHSFFPNFKTQYLFMYTLLLHQKYVLYRFLTRIGRGTHNDLSMLEQYRAELYDFETDYMFSRITEVPQYQELYDQLSRAFSLDALYADVHEPIQELSDLRSSARDRKLNYALTALSLLSGFSALADGFAFIDMGKALFPSCVLLGAKVVCSVAVLVIFIAVLHSLFRRGKK